MGRAACGIGEAALAVGGAGQGGGKAAHGVGGAARGRRRWVPQVRPVVKKKGMAEVTAPRGPRARLARGVVRLRYACVCGRREAVD